MVDRTHGRGVVEAAHLRRLCQGLRANRLTLITSQGGLLQSDPMQGVHEHVGGGGQIQPESDWRAALRRQASDRGTGAGGQVYAEPVLHVDRRTVEVDRSSERYPRRSRCDPDRIDGWIGGLAPSSRNSALPTIASLRGPDCVLRSGMRKSLNDPIRWPAGRPVLSRLLPPLTVISSAATSDSGRASAVPTRLRCSNIDGASRDRWRKSSRQKPDRRPG